MGVSPVPSQSGGKGWDGIKNIEKTVEEMKKNINDHIENIKTVITEESENTNTKIEEMKEGNSETARSNQHREF